MKSKMFFFIVFFSMLLSNYLLSQKSDSILISRTELIRFAENAINLRNCNANFNIQLQDLNQCKSTVSDCIYLNKINDSIQSNYLAVILESDKNLSKSTKRLKLFKALSFSMMPLILFETFLILKK